MRKEQYIVEIERPEGVSVAEMKEYIRDAVGAWKGGMHPEDAIFYLDHDSIKVKKFNGGVSLEQD